MNNKIYSLQPQRKSSPNHKVTGREKETISFLVTYLSAYMQDDSNKPFALLSSEQFRFRLHVFYHNICFKCRRDCYLAFCGKKLKSFKNGQAHIAHTFSGLPFCQRW